MVPISAVVFPAARRIESISEVLVVFAVRAGDAGQANALIGLVVEIARGEMPALRAHAALESREHWIGRVAADR